MIVGFFKTASFSFLFMSSIYAVGFAFGVKPFGEIALKMALISLGFWLTLETGRLISKMSDNIFKNQ